MGPFVSDDHGSDSGSLWRGGRWTVSGGVGREGSGGECFVASVFPTSFLLRFWLRVVTCPGRLLVSRFPLFLNKSFSLPRSMEVTMEVNRFCFLFSFPLGPCRPSRWQRSREGCPSLVSCLHFHFPAVAGFACPAHTSLVSYKPRDILILSFYA
ncbi:hypothetical protein V6N11_030317 [Hibiscus sabdariffa]|uniref:Uncharacterized protein n=1 Tax=Hibiscus sabdariffa TaxID=183260 RepID=A0ABR2PKI4_9ROSI